MKPSSLDSILKKHYKIIETLEDTESGTVLKVQPAEGGRELVLKVMKSEQIEDPEKLKHLRRELTALSTLHHTNIVAFYKIGLMPDGIPFGVMEYVSGKTLREVLNEEGALKPERACSILKQLCDALDYAHKKGILHRDIIPENIILVRDPVTGAEQVKLSNFKVAKFIKRETNTNFSITKTGMIVGTPGYMSPEQIIGLPIDQRSDIYTCGCLFYEMLTGSNPFEYITTPDLINLQCNEVIPPFSETKAAECRPQFEWICKMAMHKEREHRYQNAGQMHSDIMQAEQGSMNLLANPALRPQLKALVQCEEENADRTKKTRWVMLLVFLTIIAAAVALAVLSQFMPSDLLKLGKRKVAQVSIATGKPPIDWIDRVEHKNTAKIETISLTQNCPVTGTWHEYVSAKGLLRYNRKMHCGVVVSIPESKVIFFNDKTKTFYVETVQVWLDRYRSLLTAAVNELKTRAKAAAEARNGLLAPNLNYDIETLDLSNSFLTRVPFSDTQLTAISTAQVPKEEWSDLKAKGIQYSNFTTGNSNFESNGDKFLLNILPSSKSYAVFKLLYGNNFPKGLPVKVVRLNHNGSHTVQFDTKEVSSGTSPISLFSYPNEYKQVNSEQAVVSDEEGQKIERKIYETPHDVSDDVQDLLNDGSAPTPGAHSGAD